MATDNELFKPPFVGSRLAKGIPARRHRRLYQSLTALFRNQWGYRPEGETRTTRPQRAQVSARIARGGGQGQGGRPPRPPSGVYGPLRRQLGGATTSSSTRTESHAAPSGCGSPSPAGHKSHGCASRRLLPPRPTRSEGDVRLLHAGHHGLPGVRGGRQRPVSTPTRIPRGTCSSTASGWRWPRLWPSTGTIASARSSASPEKGRAHA